MKNKLKSLLALALAAFTSLTWAAELVIPYSFDGKTGNTEYAYEYNVVMPNTALTSFTTTIRYASGNHRVEILSVKLLDGETEYTAVATGTEGTEVVVEGASYSGGNNYHNIYTFTNNEGFTANKVYTLQANLKVTNDNPSHNGNIKVSGGLICLTPTYWASFDNSNVSSDKVWSSGGISFGGSASYGYVPVLFGNKAFDLSNDAWGQQTFLSANPTAFTLSLNAKTGTAANGILIAFGSKNSTGGLVVRRGADGNEIIVTKANSTDAIITANAPGSSVGYTNIVLTYGNETLSLYINGDLAGTANVTAGDLIPGPNFQLGRRHGGLVDSTKEANNVNGAIDELVAWNGTALTADQVKAFYNENYADALKNTSIALFYEFEGTDAATFGNKAWDYNSPSSGNSSAEATYHNSARTMSGDIAYKSVVLDKNVHPGMSYSWPEEFTIATYVNLSECKTDGTIVSIGKSLLLRKIDGIRMALCNNGAIQYVWAEDENLSIGYHLIVVRKTATSLSLQIDDGPAQVVVLAEGNSPEITGGLQLGVRWEGGYASYDNTDDGVGVGPHLDDFLVWNGALSDASVANLCVIYPEILTEVVSAEPDGVGPHKLSDLITNGLKTGANVIATVTLADGATLEIDQALNFSELEIVSSGSIKVKVSDLTITQAQLNAIINTNGVSGTVSTDYEEHLEGYTVNGVTYPLIFRGTTDANWTTLSNWYTGYRRNSTDIYWIPYTGTVVPGAPNSNEWRATLVDGDLMVIAAGEDGYKTVTLPDTTNYEGWATKIAAYNKAHIVIGRANKFQSDANSGPGFLRVDDTSKITFQAYGNGNGTGDKSIYVNAPEGIVFAEGTISGVKNMTYYFDGDGSVAFATLNEVQKIAGLELVLGDSTLSGRKVISRKLIGFTGGNATFTVAENAVTASVDTVTPEAAEILQNVGQYKFEKKADGYYVDYVAYAETDEIGAMNTWTKGEDALWATVGNWSSGSVPAEGATVAISITADTTITIPEGGVTVDMLVVNGEGTLTIAGGKLTATKIFANANIAAGEDTLALAEMDIAEGKTVTYTTTTTAADPDNVGNSHALTLKAMTGAGTFVKKGTGIIGLFATAAEPAIVVEEGAIYVRDAPTTAMNIAAKAGAEIRLAAWHVNFANTANKITLDGGAQLTLANGANVSGTITIANAAETAAKICGSSFNASTIAAAITGAGKVEFADGGSFGDATKYPCDGATTYSGVISGDLQVIISDTSAVTFTANNTYTGGTVIAEGATVSVSNINTIFGTGNVTGAGTVKIAGGTYNGLSLAQYTDANTTIEIPADNTVTGYFNSATWTCAAKIQLDGTLSLINGFGAGRYTFTGPWTGAGGISLSHASPADAVRITGDISGFTGDISVAGARALTFCAATTGNNQKYAGKICVHGDYAYTAMVNGTWSAPVVVENGAKIGGEGSIANTLTFNAGSIIDGSVVATGDVTLNGTVTVSGEAGATVLTCANAESLDLTKFAAPEGLKCVADGNTVKLALANVSFVPATAESMSVEVAAATEDDAIAMVDIQRPEGVGDDVVSAEDYAAYFTKTATGENGTYTVTVSLKDDVKPVVGTTADADDAFTVDADGVTIAINNYKPGLYYGIRSATELGALKTVEAVNVDVKEGKINVAKLTGDSAFYQVVVDVKPFPSVNDGAEGDAPEAGPDAE